MPHPHLGFRFVEDGNWAALNGPAADEPADPHVLVMACSRRELLEGVLVGVSARNDCVRVRYRLDPVRGVRRAEVRFVSDAGAGEVASTLKSRGFRPLLHPVILDEAWWAPFRDGEIPDGQRWQVTLDADLPNETFEGAASWPWAVGCGHGKTERSDLPSVKICLASWDRKRMDGVLAALTQHPRCYGVKGNHPNADDVSFLGRAVFTDAETTGWVARQLQEQCPDVVPVVQDDAWFKQYREQRVTQLHDFYGLWALDPDSCEYDAGMPPPRAAVHTILPHADALWFHVRWTDLENAVHHMAFESPSDGSPRQPGPEGPALTSRLEADTLVTEVTREGAAIHTTRRSLVDGALEVHQRILTDLGFQETRARYVRTTAKQVLLYRRDLKMRKGKIAAQCAHAAMAVFFQRNQGHTHELRVPLDGPMAAWVGGRFTKICLSLDDEEALNLAYETARQRGLPAALITDAGRTEFRGVPTRTAVAIGPAAVPEVDAITGPDGIVACKLA